MAQRGLEVRTVGPAAPSPDGTADGHDDLTRAHQLYRRLALYDMPFEVKIGLNLSYYRTFATPRIASLLARTGEIERQPMKRSIDTGLLMYELIDSGPTSERGRQVIRMLNRMHHRWPIEDADYAYVLATFIVPTCRWIDTFGWRRTTAEEREGITTFYRRVGRLMGIRRLPESYMDAEEILDSYEAANLRRSPEGVALMASTADVFAALLPARARRLAPRLLGLMLDDRLCGVLDVQRPSPLTRRLFRVAMAVRALIVRLKPRRDQPFFLSGRTGSSLYPGGWELSDLGVGDPAH